jgi:hypothetical protein
MPSFFKLLILSSLLLSGVLSLPTALPNGVLGKREADPKPDNSFHFGGDFDGGLTRGGSYKREAEADQVARNTLSAIPNPPETEKREATPAPAPVPAVDNGFHFGGDFDSGLTRGGSYKRDAEVDAREEEE